jgi:putative tryptophan/tyrosine transport system substrate-binding protein
MSLPVPRQFSSLCASVAIIEGQNIVTEYRYAEAKNDRAPELGAELARLKVDIIVAAGGDPVIRAAKNATKKIPIVMTGSAADPVAAGYVESLARPGGNVTGLTNLIGELGGKRLELLKEAVPKLTRVAVLYDAASPGIVLDVKEILPVAARSTGEAHQRRARDQPACRDDMAGAARIPRHALRWLTPIPLHRSHQCPVAGNQPKIAPYAGLRTTKGGDNASEYSRFL